MSRSDLFFDLLGPLLANSSPFWSEDEVRRLSDALSQVMPQPSLPSATETAAIALVRPKTAALCFDRIWAGVFGKVPPELTFFGDTTLEHQLTALWVMRQFASDRSQEHAQHFTKEHISKLLFSFLQIIDKTAGREIIDYIVRTGNAEPVSRVYANAIAAQHNIPVVPIYSSTLLRTREYTTGDRHAVITLISDLELVDEDSLEWSQVVEFRSDSQSRRKYRRFLHWLDSEMVGKPLSYIEDEVNIRLDDYRQAVRKHGLRTMLGTCSAVLDPRTIVPAAGMYGTFAAFSHDLVGAIAAGSIVLARGAIHVAEALLNLDDTRRVNPEVAFVYEITQTSS